MGFEDVSILNVLHFKVYLVTAPGLAVWHSKNLPAENPLKRLGGLVTMEKTGSDECS